MELVHVFKTEDILFCGFLLKSQVTYFVLLKSKEEKREAAEGMIVYCGYSTSDKK